MHLGGHNTYIPLRSKGKTGVCMHSILHNHFEKYGHMKSDMQRTGLLAAAIQSSCFLWHILTQIPPRLYKMMKNLIQKEEMKRQIASQKGIQPVCVYVHTCTVATLWRGVWASCDNSHLLGFITKYRANMQLYGTF